MYCLIITIKLTIEEEGEEEKKYYRMVFIIMQENIKCKHHFSGILIHFHADNPRYRVRVTILKVQ